MVIHMYLIDINHQVLQTNANKFGELRYREDIRTSWNTTFTNWYSYSLIGIDILGYGP